MRLYAFLQFDFTFSALNGGSICIVCVIKLNYWNYFIAFYQASGKCVIVFIRSGSGFEWFWLCLQFVYSLFVLKNSVLWFIVGKDKNA